MWDIWIAFIIGIVEGLTEFLPVSSTGHMIIAGHWLGFEGDMAETFEIVIQLGAIMAVVVLYWRRLGQFFTKEQSFNIGGKHKQPTYKLNVIHIVLAIFPALGLAYLLRDFIKEVLFSPQTVVIGLVLGGIFLIIAEKNKGPIETETMEQLTYRQAFFIGIAQCLSLWPGFSRSGATIAGGMLAGASRAASANFTFIIAIPVMAIATGYEILNNYRMIFTMDLPFFAVGFFTSFFVALLAVFTFIKLVQKISLTYFAYYRFALALVVLLYYLQ